MIDADARPIGTPCDCGHCVSERARLESQPLRLPSTQMMRDAKSVWDDIGRYYTGDHRAWAFVNYCLHGSDFRLTHPLPAWLRERREA